MGGPLGTPDTAGGFQGLVVSETWPEDAVQKPSEGVLRAPGRESPAALRLSRACGVLSGRTQRKGLNWGVDLGRL